MNGTRHREVGEYLRRLQRSMGDLPAERREEILAEIEEHIAEELAEQPSATDADVRNVLERVGDPEDIAAEARERFEITPASPRFRRPASSWTDIGAVTLLVLGSLMITPSTARNEWSPRGAPESCCCGCRRCGAPGTRSVSRWSCRWAP